MCSSTASTFSTRGWNSGTAPRSPPALAGPLHELEACQPGQAVDAAVDVPSDGQPVCSVEQPDTTKSVAALGMTPEPTGRQKRTPATPT